MGGSCSSERGVNETNEQSVCLTSIQIGCDEQNKQTNMCKTSLHTYLNFIKDIEKLKKYDINGEVYEFSKQFSTLNEKVVQDTKAIFENIDYGIFTSEGEFTTYLLSLKSQNALLHVNGVVGVEIHFQHPRNVKIDGRDIIKKGLEPNKLYIVPLPKSTQGGNLVMQLYKKYCK